MDRIEDFKKLTIEQLEELIKMAPVHPTEHRRHLSMSPIQAGIEAMKLRIEVIEKLTAPETLELLDRSLKAQVLVETITKAYHDLIAPGESTYSWQRDWQNIARKILDLPTDSTMEDIQVALLLRDGPNG